VGVILVAECGDEDDRDVDGALALADKLCGLKAVHPRHVDVEQDDREVVGEQRPQRLPPAVGADDVLPQFLQHRLQRQELVRLVVDDEDVDFVGVHHGKC
jgi:hypothetical protein